MTTPAHTTRVAGPAVVAFGSTAREQARLPTAAPATYVLFDYTDLIAFAAAITSFADSDAYRIIWTGGAVKPG